MKNVDRHIRMDYKYLPANVRFSAFPLLDSLPGTPTMLAELDELTDLDDYEDFDADFASEFKQGPSHPRITKLNSEV